MAELVRRRRLPVIAVAVVCAVVGIGLVQGQPSGSRDDASAPGFPTGAEMEAALAGAPAALAALHGERGELIKGEAVAQIRALRGTPVVVNAWGTWCAPCVSEFPVFARVSTEMGKRVAFLGVNTTDVEARARRFLREHPVAYPSLIDGEGAYLRHVGALGLPFTVFVNPDGEQFVHQGGFDSVRALRLAIHRYALN